jgi:hypothetical protein
MSSGDPRRHASDTTHLSDTTQRQPAARHLSQIDEGGTFVQKNRAAIFRLRTAQFAVPILRRQIRG